MKKYLSIIGLMFLGAFSFASAAGLTQNQIDAVLNLLRAFGAEGNVISNVESALTGAPVTTAPSGPSTLPTTIQNPGFELDPFASANWKTDAYLGGCEFSADATVAHSGSRSGKIVCQVDNDARWLQTVAVEPNTNYVLSTWIKTDNVLHSPQSVDAGANLSQFGTWNYSSPVFGTQDWTQKTFRFNSGNATHVDIALRLGYWSGVTKGTVWFDDVTLTRADGQVIPPPPPPPPSSDSLSLRAPEGTQPSGLAWDGSSLWLSSYMKAPGIYKISPSNGAILNKCTPSTAQFNGYDGLAFDGAALWQADGYGGGIYKLDPTTCSVLHKISVPDSYPSDLAWDGTNLWVAGYPSQKLYKLNPSTGAVVNFYPLPAGVGQAQTIGLEFAEGALWLSTEGELFKINPANGAILSSLPLSISRPDALAWDGTNMWVASFDKATLTKISTSAGGKADLKVSLSAPERAEAGSSIRVPITAYNVGSAVAPGSGVRAGYMIDVVLSHDMNVPGGYAVFSPNYFEDVMLRGGRISVTRDLMPNTNTLYEYSYELPSDVPTGNYYVCAVIDPGKVVSEVFEDNNFSCAPVAIQGKTLPAGAVSITVTSPTEGDVISAGTTRKVSWTSTNTPAGAWVGRVAVYRNHGAVFSHDLVPFLSQQPTSGSVDWAVPPGSATGSDFRIQVILYTGTPTNESFLAYDWSDSFTITSSNVPPSAPGSDLVVTEITPFTSSLIARGIQVKLCNMGNQSTVSFPLRIAANGVTQDFTFPTLSLAAGACSPHAWEASMWGMSPGGTYTITATADPNNIITESNETNNIYITSIALSSSGSVTSLPNPSIVFTGTEDYEANGQQWTRYRIRVDNWSSYTDDLFRAAPDLPACGLNPNSSRTWVNIYNAQTNAYIYGFCAFRTNTDLQLPWFAVARGTNPPASVYLTLVDRETGKTYKSNNVTLPQIPVSSASPALGESLSGLRGALNQLQQLLNNH